jgi:hypothetical protein
VSSDLVKIISPLIGNHSLTKQKDNEISYKCSLLNARQIRSTLADSLSQYPQIWFSIDYPNQSNKSLSKFQQNIDHIFFGSLFSTEKFLIHDTPLTKTNHWIIKIANKQTLTIESNDETSSIRLSIPFKFLHKDILVIDGEDFSEIIFSYNIITIEIRTNKNLKYEK